MSRNLSDVIAADIDDVFLNTDEFAVEITYSRRGSPVRLSAIQDSSMFESSNQFGITQTKTKDFLIEVAALIIAGELTEPAKGDVICLGNKTYVVTAQPGGRPDEYDDDDELMWRVHATLKAT